MSRSGDFTKKSTLKKIELVLSQMYKEFSTTQWVLKIFFFFNCNLFVFVCFLVQKILKHLLKAVSGFILK